MNKEEKSKALSDFWEDIPRSQVVNLRSKICQKCDVSAQIFYFWKQGKTEIPLLACEKMNEIFGKKVFRL